MKRALLPLLCFTVLGCANIKVTKVPHPPSYVLEEDCDGLADRAPCWNELQSRADALKGVRYYLPRPYVVVKQEFAVGGGTFVVPGRIDEQGRVIQIDAVPDELRRFFPAGQIDAGQVRQRSDAGDSRGDLQAEDTEETSGDGDAGAGDAGRQAVAPTLVSDAQNHLKDSTVSHADVPSKETVVTLTIKVSKNALVAGGPFGDGPVLDEAKAYLVPVSQGQHTATGLVVATRVAAPPQGQPGEDRTLQFQVEGAKVPAHASLGVGIEGTVEGQRKTFVLHRKATDLHSSFGPATAEPAKEEEEDDEETKEVGGAKGTVSGDPTTDPLIEVSPLYDVLLLPDWSEQYAIDVRSGVFQAAADIGLENGWMAEKLNIDIDNSALGNFLLESATKLIDAGLGQVFPDIGETVDQAQEQPEAELQAEEPLVVLLRVDFAELAVPGVYPIVKESEQGCARKRGEGLGGCVPRVDWRTRSTLAVTLLESRPAEPAPAGEPEPACGASKILEDEETFAGADKIRARFKNGRVILDASELPDPAGGTAVTVGVFKVNLVDSALSEEGRRELEQQLREALNQIRTRRGCPGSIARLSVVLKES